MDASFCRWAERMLAKRRDPHGYTAEPLENFNAYDAGSHLHFVVPFDVSSVDVDERIPAANKALRPISRSVLSNRIAKNAWRLDDAQYRELSHHLRGHNMHVRHALPAKLGLYRALNKARPGHPIVVRIIDVPTYRYLITALKDILFQAAIHNKRAGGFSGADIVTLPVAFAPFWTGTTWKAASFSELATGIPLHAVMWHGLFPPRRPAKLSLDTDAFAVMRAVYKAVHTLWYLGFVHCDLYDRNVFFDPDTGSVKFIDFETCTALPDDIVAAYRRETDAGGDIQGAFERTYLYPALSLLALSANVGLRFTTNNFDNMFLATCFKALKLRRACEK
jgi:serine/threonine protein kinase